MCLPFPAPRCSHHASQEYQLAERKFAHAVTVEAKLEAGAELQRKKEAYYLTPRGLNELRQELTTASEANRPKIEADILRYEQLRKNALDAYQATIDRSDTELVELLASTGRKLTRDEKATTITSLNLERDFSIDVTVEDTSTILTEKFGRVLCLAHKHQHLIGKATLAEAGWETQTPHLQHLLRTINHDSPNQAEQAALTGWWIKTLTHKGYQAFSVVNLRTQDSALYSLNKLGTIMSAQLNLVKRQGGTTNWLGNIDHLRKIIAGTDYAGEIIQSREHKKTLITGVAADLPSHGIEDLYLARRKEGTYEVRRRHISSIYDVHLRLTTNMLPLHTSVHEDLTSETA